MTLRISSPVAAVAFALLGFSACSRERTHSETQKPHSPKLINSGFSEERHSQLFSGCADLKNKLKETLQVKFENENERKAWLDTQPAMPRTAVPEAAMPVSTTSSSGANVGTNVQVEGVDEADFVKVGSQHIFTAHDNLVEVVTRGGEKKNLGQIQAPDFQSFNLYATKEHLIFIGPKKGTDSETLVKIYDITAPGMPSLKTAHTISGLISESRIVDNKVFIVSRKALTLDANKGSDQTFSFASETDVFPGLKCDSVSRPLIDDADFTITMVSEIDLSSPKEAPKSIGVMGAGENLYASANNLYLYKNQPNWQPWVSPVDTKKSEKYEEKVYISKVKLGSKSSNLSYAASGTVPGRVKDVWAFNEMPSAGVLAVATTTGYLGASGQDEAKNHLWILKDSQEKLDIAKSLNDFGVKEDIRSVRYVGDMAYIVTFKKTDPLFAIDLKDPLAPKIVGELKVPGFSLYMHPVAPGRMIGVGFDAADQGNFAYYQGIQVSLFDTSDPTKPTRLDNKIIGGRGSYSDVTSDHKAFFFDPKSNTVGIPVVQFEGQNSVSDLAGTLKFSGVVFYRIGERSLEEIGRVSHSDYLNDEAKQIFNHGRWWQESSASMDINRALLVNDEILTVSRSGLKWHAPSALGEQISAIKF